MAGETILVVDDEMAMGDVLVRQLSQVGYTARAVDSGQGALALIASSPVDLVITDFKMSGMDGMTLLSELARVAPDVPAIMLTGHGNVQRAVEAMKAGAKEFVMKPHDRNELIAIVERVLDTFVRTEKRPASRLARDVVSESPAMRECRETMSRAAKSMATVLLRGESGAGKEVAARAIHDESKRPGPFEPVHCSAIPDALLESELFGYAKGAFTGAVKDKPGRVELAAGGTLFFDEIGDVSATVQVKLLRLLAEKEFQRVGGTHAQHADVRFIAATHRNLEEMVEAGTFREDLFYRLNIIPIRIPALRDRKDDIPALAKRFCIAAAEENKKRIVFSDDALAMLREQPWRGNVRELHAFVERLVVFSDGAEIVDTDVRRELAREPLRPSTSTASGPSSDSLRASISEAKRQKVLEALSGARGNKSAAARLLGIDRRTLYNMIKELGITLEGGE
jgi:DNA-binding NtrC family response regulator